MSAHVLDNPVWNALEGPLRHWARAAGDFKRFVPDAAPFVAVKSPESKTDALEQVVGDDELVYFLGVMPRLDERWAVVSHEQVLQFVIDRAVPAPDGVVVERVEGDDGIRELRALASQVYPAFFRPRTAQLGRFYAVREEGAVVAMGGERLRVDGYQEVSTVCTLPSARQAGLAKAIVASAQRGASDRGARLFCHTVQSNQPVLTLFKHAGLRPRAVLPMWGVRRAGA